MSEELRSGWLSKKGAGLLPSVKQRWIVLSGSAISYYANERSKKQTPKGSVPIVAGQTKAKPADASGGVFRFVVQSTPSSREYVFMAKTAADRDEWVAAINGAAGAGDAPAAAPAAASAPAPAAAPAAAAPAAAPSAKKSPAPQRPQPPAKAATKEPEAKPTADPPAAAPTTSSSETDPDGDGRSTSAPQLTPKLTDKTTSADEWKEFRSSVASQPELTDNSVAREAGIMTTIRVFVSSTFVDEHGERDELVRRVFAELNTVFRERWVQVVPVDLRWGVSSEQTSVIQQTCLNEIDNCRARPNEAPWFIGLRGQRYGWVQEKYDSPDAYITPEYYSWLSQLETRAPVSITSLEVYHATLGCRRGANDAAKGPHALILNRNPAFKEKVPKGMRWLFDFEYKGENEEIDEDVQFQYSKTPRVDAYRDDLADLNEQLKVSPDVCAWAEYNPTFGEEGDGSLVQKTGQLPTGKMFGVGYVGGLSDFGKAAYDFLYNQIDKEYPPLPAGTPLEVERVQHKAVVISRSENFLGRESLLEKMTDYVRGTDTLPFVVWGKPGSGKSALMAKFCRQLDGEGKGTVVLSHIVGATGSSQSLRGTLQRFAGELKLALDIKKDVPFRVDELKTFFFEILEGVAKNRKVKSVVLVIDAVNQMLSNDDAHKLAWIPFPLPDKVKIVISTLPEENQCLAHLRARRPAPLEMEVPVLEQADRMELVSASLAKYHKKLTTDDSDKFLGNQMALLMKKKESGSPLYLIAAVEELRTFAVYEKMTQFLAKELPGTVLDLFVHLLNRLENDHGRELVQQALALIAVSRSGLFEIEMIEMLRLVEWTDEPISNFSRLYAGIKLFVSTGGSGLMQFFHQQLLRVVRKRYLSSPQEELEAHALAATYFESKIDPKGEQSWDGDYPRGFEALCFHLMSAGQWDKLEAVMCDLRFLTRRSETSSAFDIVTDFLAAPGLDTSNKLSPKFAEFSRFFVANAYIIARHPDQVITLAAARPPSSAVCLAVRDISIEAPFIQWVNREDGAETPLTLSIKPIEEAEERVKVYLSFSPDGKTLLVAARHHSGSCVKAYNPVTGTAEVTMVEKSREAEVQDCLFLPDGRRVAVAMDLGKRKHGICLFDIQTGDPVGEMTSDDRAVVQMSVSPDGKHMCAVDDNNQVMLWSLKDCQPMKTSDSAKGIECRWLNNKEIIVVTDSDQLHVYSLALKQLRTLISGQLHNHVGHLNVSPSGKYVAISGKGQRNVWGLLDMTMKNPDFVFEDTHDTFVLSTLHEFSQDESMLVLVTLSNDAALSQLHLYDVAAKKEIASTLANVQMASSLSFAPDGSKIAVVGMNGMVRLFDVALLKQSAQQESAPKVKGYSPTEHESTVESLFYSPDQKMVVSTAVDMAAASAASGRAIFWDSGTGTFLSKHLMNVREGKIFGVAPPGASDFFFAKIDGQGYSGGREYTLKVMEYPSMAIKSSVMIGPGPGEKNMLGGPEAVRFRKDLQRAYVLLQADFKRGNEVRVYDLEANKELKRYPNNPDGSNEKCVDMELSPSGDDICVLFSKNVYVIAAEDGSPKVKFTELRKAANVYTCHQAAFFDDGDRVVVCGADYSSNGFVTVLPLRSGDNATPLITMTGESTFTSCGLTADGARVVTTSSAAISVFDIESGAQLASLRDGDVAIRVAVSRQLSDQGCIQFAAGYTSGAVKIMQLVERKEQMLDEKARAEKRAALIEEHTKKPAAAAAAAGGGGGSAQACTVTNTVPLESVGANNGALLAALTIDGKAIVPTSEQTFYKTQWTTVDRVMEGLPEFCLPEWPESLGTFTSLSGSICALDDKGQPDYQVMYLPTTGLMVTPGTPFQFQEGQIMKTGGSTEMGLECIPPGEYFIMFNAMGSGGMDQLGLVVTVV